METNSRTVNYDYWVTSTRINNITHVKFWIHDCTTHRDIVNVEGRNKWQNRPWERYDGASALRDALRKIGASPENIQQVGECDSLSHAMDYLREHLHIKIPYKTEYVFFQNI